MNFGKINPGVPVLKFPLLHWGLGSLVTLVGRYLLSFKVSIGRPRFKLFDTYYVGGQ